jgi:mannan endo-1,4-beta-mannosidase
MMFYSPSLKRHVAKIINMVLFYQIYRVSGQNDNAQMEFMQRWMSSHWTDSKTILKKPLVFAEFGKSNKDPGYTTSVRDSFLNTVHTSIYNSARNGGTIGGGFVWQILAEGMDSYYDGYEIVYLKIHQQAVSLLNSLIR